jgi:hypothetical protein
MRLKWVIPTPTLCSSPLIFLWGRHWLIRLNPYVIQQETRVKVALQGGAERFWLCYRPEAPFHSHREFAHPVAHPTALVRFHSRLLSLLEPGSDALSG